MRSIYQTRSRGKKLPRSWRKPVRRGGFNSAVQSAWESFPAIIHFHTKLKEEDATCHGLLIQMNNIRFLACLYVVKYVLPILDKILSTFHHQFQSSQTRNCSAKAALEQWSTCSEIQRRCEGRKDGCVTVFSLWPSVCIHAKSATEVCCCPERKRWPEVSKHSPTSWCSFYLRSNSSSWELSPYNAHKHCMAQRRSTLKCPCHQFF